MPLRITQTDQQPITMKTEQKRQNRLDAVIALLKQDIRLREISSLTDIPLGTISKLIKSDPEATKVFDEVKFTRKIGQCSNIMKRYTVRYCAKCDKVKPYHKDGSKDFKSGMTTCKLCRYKEWMANLHEAGLARNFIEYRETYVEAHGPIPEGYEIHHIDGNSSNNSIDNLIALSPVMHWMFHYDQGDHQAATLIKLKHGL